MEEHEYVHALEHQRRHKDQFFAQHPQSPIPPEDRKAFQGLRHFPPRRDHRVVALWEPAAAPRLVQVGTSTGGMKDYLEAGTLRFELAGQDLALKGYQNPEHPHGLFVPFRDGTSGKESYGAARYLDLDEPDESGEVVMDFNLAYNPYCAYSEAYTCPLPPRENWLAVPVEAGEKAYKEA